MTQRVNGESSISKGKDGRWHGYVSMGTKEGGKRDRRHVADPKKANVLEAVKQLEKQRDDGVALASGKALTVEQWLNLWLTTICARRVRPKTYERYESVIRLHLIPHLGHHRVDRLQPEHLEAAYAAMETAGLSSASVLKNHRVLSRALKVALQRGRVVRNVCTLVDAPTVVRDEIQPLTATEARKILAVAKDMDNGARWSVALALGLRQGEALGLLWESVDLDAGTLTVRRALQRHKGKGLVLVEPKSNAGKRTIKLPEPLRVALTRHRTWQLQQRMAAGSEWQDGDYVFCQPNGKPFGARSDWARWKKLLAAAEVRDARLHDARHTAATLLLMQGVPARVVMQILGHSQISMTTQYQHVVPELAQEAAERMGEALWG